MELSKYSRNQILKTLSHWEVPRDFADPMFNYLVHGYSPGGCFTSILANDFYMAIHRSHPANTIEALKALSGWIRDVMPAEARGSYDAVDTWCKLDSIKRRAILEKKELIFKVEEETWMTLQGIPVTETVLY